MFSLREYLHVFNPIYSLFVHFLFLSLLDPKCPKDEKYTIICFNLDFIHL